MEFLDKEAVIKSLEELFRFCRSNESCSDCPIGYVCAVYFGHESLDAYSEEAIKELQREVPREW